METRLSSTTQYAIDLLQGTQADLVGRCRRARCWGHNGRSIGLKDQLIARLLVLGGIRGRRSPRQAGLGQVGFCTLLVGVGTTERSAFNVGGCVVVTALMLTRRTKRLFHA
jgi:hypothetical protein